MKKEWMAVHGDNSFKLIRISKIKEFNIDPIGKSQNFAITAITNDNKRHVITRGMELDLEGAIDVLHELISDSESTIIDEGADEDLEKSLGLS